ncbi:MAG: recombinase family protein [Parcubacteria group bacterium]|nr:recombinase family protein [Parcubacteria group bacterium]
MQNNNQTQLNNDESTPVRYCLYARKSTESDEKQVMSIDSQIKEMLDLAKKENLEIADIRKESHSAKDSGQRPIYNQIIKDIKKGIFSGILTWAPDRLSRNAGDLGALVDLMDQKLLIEIRTYGQKFINSPNEKFLLTILGAQGKLENDQKSVNVQRGLRAKCQQGLWPAMAPTGYLNEKRTDRKGYVLIDPKRAPIIKQMFEKVANEQLSGRKVCRWLKDDLDFKTKNGKNLSLANIYRLLKTTFYYGMFEYPRGGGNFYTGKHSPIISKDLFDRVQQQISLESHIRENNKEFAFTKLLKCGLCGSGITADEKFKKLKDGSTKKYIYYGCTRSKNLYCKCGYIREEELINQFIKIINKVNINELGIRNKLEQEVDRYHNFQTNVLGIKTKKSTSKEADIKSYAKYILLKGNILEKRDLLTCIKSQLVLANKKVILGK